MGAAHMRRIASMKRNDAEVVNLGPQKRDDFWSRVEGRVENGTADACWLFGAHVSVTGYGVFYFKAGTKVSAHRFALLVTQGMPPEDGYFYACHKCENKNCVRPEHLYWGTPKDNMRDAWADPRNRTEEKRLSAKYRELLSDEQIKEMWHSYWFESANVANLASMYQCSPGYVSMLMSGRYRKHVTRYLSKPLEPRKRIATVVGDRHPRAKLTDEQVQFARRLIVKGVEYPDIARTLGVTPPAIRSIATGRTRSALPWPDEKRSPKRTDPKLNDVYVREIRDLVARGWSLADVGRKYHVSYVTIGRIRDRKLYGHVQ